MGVVKKLKGKELVGWSQQPDVDVYPITHIGAIYNDDNIPLTDILSNMELEIHEGGGVPALYPVNYLWAYTVAKTDAEAVSKLDRNQQADVPTNFVNNTSFPIEDGYFIYMTNARKQEGIYLVWEDGTIWSAPIRMGSGYTTSYTGNDGEGYNYAYCRTATLDPPNVPQSLTVERLEDLSKQNKGIAANGGAASTATFNVWYDHPFGVERAYPYEWVVIARGNDGQGWSAYSLPPVLWAKFGVNGQDGDGCEYIFTAIALGDPVPEFNVTYTGRIGESGATYYQVNIADCETDIHYQMDDFIPINWHDNPLVLSQDCNLLYVSIRKKKFTSDNDGYWGPFSLPVLWSKISDSAYTITLDNDAVIADDDTSSQALENVSYSAVHIWDGSKDITVDNDYYIEITALSINGASDFLLVNVVDKVLQGVVSTVPISDASYVNNHGFEYVYPVDTYKRDIDGNNTYEMVFCISKQATVQKMTQGSYGILFRAKVYEDSSKRKLLAEIKRTQSVKVVDINDGTAYMLVVNPNSLGISREDKNSSYKFNGISTLATVQLRTAACSGESTVSYCRLYGELGAAVNEGDLYVTITPYGTDNTPRPSRYAVCTAGSGTDTLYFTLSGLDDGCWYYVANLWLMHDGSPFNIDSETIDLSVKGDDGESAYYITMDNDGAVIDDQTISAEALRTITENHVSCFFGSQDITRDVTFISESSNLPSVLTIVHPQNSNTFYIQPTETIGELVPVGDYWYTITAKNSNGETIANKIFTFLVRNITPDGTSFKLVIENDTWVYSGNSHEYVGAEDYSQLSVSAIKTTADGLVVTPLSFDMTTEGNLNTWTPSAGLDYPLVVTYPATYGSLVDVSNKTVRVSTTYIRGPISFSLYYKVTGQAAAILDSENIDTLENGKDGTNGEGAYVMTFDNDNALIDDLTVNQDVLYIATINNISVKRGSEILDLNADYTLYVTTLYLPSGMKLVAGSTTVTQTGRINSTLIYLKGTPSSSQTWTKGTYTIIILARDTLGTSVLDLRRYKLTIDEISADGSIYKIDIVNDVWHYDGEGALIGDTSLNPTTFRLTKVGNTNNEPAFSLETFSIAKEGSGGYSSTGWTITYPSLLDGKVAMIGSDNKEALITALSTYNSAHTTHTLKLYYKGVFTGEAETLDCVQNGKNGGSVYSMSFDNDNALIDNDTMVDLVLLVATENNITVMLGSQTLTLGTDYTLFVTYLDLPDVPNGMKLKTGSGQEIKTKIINASDAVQITSTKIYFQKGSNPPSVWTNGTYVLKIEARDINRSTVLDVKKYKLKIDNISADGSIYKIGLTNDVWTYSGEGTKLSEGNSGLTVYKISVNASGTLVYELQDFTVSSGSASDSGFTVIYPSSLSGQVKTTDAKNKYIIPLSRYNANITTFNLTLYYNREPTGESETISCVANGAKGDSSQGVQGGVLRNRGLWKSGLNYCYNTDNEGRGPDVSPVVYIDYVLYNGTYYACQQFHTSSSSNSPGHTDYWVGALNFEFIATKMLVANSADIEVLSGGSLIIKDDLDYQRGGMTGGRHSSASDIIIWAGASASNMSDAPFRVSEDGSFVSTKGTIYSASIHDCEIYNLRSIPEKVNRLSKPSSDFLVIDPDYFTLELNWGWTSDFIGRKITILDPRGISTSSSFSNTTLKAPSGQWFYINGDKVSTLSLKHRIIEMIGYGSGSSFYGWIVTNVRNVASSRVSSYGKPLDCLAVGHIRLTCGGSSYSLTSSLFLMFNDGKITNPNTGDWTTITPNITWDNSKRTISVSGFLYWLLLSGYLVMLTPYSNRSGGDYSQITNSVLASLATKDPTLFTIFLNPGSFTSAGDIIGVDFMMYNEYALS